MSPEMQAYINEVVAQAPPLSPAMAADLGALLRPRPGLPAGRDTAA